jgi:uncharacterized C2H2 Zn-finger protein
LFEITEILFSEDRPFVCALCGWSTKQIANLTTHRKKAHGIQAVRGKGRKPAKNEKSDENLL